jgi:hypothetical protein
MWQKRPGREAEKPARQAPNDADAYTCDSAEGSADCGLLYTKIRSQCVFLQSESTKSALP